MIIEVIKPEGMPKTWTRIPPLFPILTILYFLTKFPLQWGRFPKEKSLRSETVLFCNYKVELELLNIYFGAQDLKFMK